MTRRLALAGLVLAGGSFIQAQAARSPEAQFKAAQQKEEVEGDLTGAIAEYKRVVERAGRHHDILWIAAATVVLDAVYDGGFDLQAAFGRV